MQTVARLPEIAEIIMGQSPPGDTYNEVGAGLPFFQGKAEFGEVSPTIKKWCTAPKKVAESGDILISVRAPVGPTNLAVERCCIGRGLAAIRANKSRLNLDYLHFFLRYVEPQLANMGQGSTFAAIGRTELASLSVPLPPLAEQRRIVDILSRAEGIVRLRREAQKKAAEIVPALFVDMFGAPATNPKRWREESLGDHIDFLTGYAFKSNEFVGADENAVRLCRGANVLPQCIDWSDVRFWPKNRINEVDKFRLSEGDIVLAMDRPWISRGLKVAAISNTDVPCLLVQRVARIRPKENVISEFIYSVLCHEHFAKHCNAVKTETVVPHISPYDICSFRIFVPPIPEQKHFATIVEQIRSIQSQQISATGKAEVAFAVLLGQMFN